MNRINTPDAARKLEQMLGEMTGQKVEHFEIGESLSLATGGSSRDIDAHLDGVKRRLMATEIDGQVNIVDRRFGLAPNELTEHYERLDAAQRKEQSEALERVTANAKAGIVPDGTLNASGWPIHESANSSAEHSPNLVNRIDTPDAARQLRDTLEEMTRQRVENFKLGDPDKLAGGGMSREVTATVGGADRSYHAIEIGGQVSLVQQGLGVSPQQGHELLQRAEAANSLGGKQTNGWPSRATATEHAASQVSQVRARRR